jgi:hypothetical protein
MRRLPGLLGAALLVALLGVPAVLAAEPDLPHTGRVVMAFNGDITIPAGEQADAVIVGQGEAVIGGTVNTLVVLDGSATLTGATVESVVVISGTLALEEGTVVLGDVRSIESTVSRADGVTVEGEVKGLDAELFMLGAFLVPALFLFALGMALATILAGLVLVAIGSRQVRAAERLIVNEPAAVVVIGLVTAIVAPLLAVIAIITIVGAPLGLGMLLAVLPALAFLGFLVAGIFIGEQILGSAKDPSSSRPYKAAFLGLVVLLAVGLIPGIGPLATAIASVLGLGAILLLAWRTLRGAGTGEAAAPGGAPVAIGA